MPKIVGIIGGVGPAAGLDLHRKILLESGQATRDQEHLEVLLHTNPRVPDRTRFLLRKSRVNPSHELIRSAGLLVRAGAELLAVPCMTAHCDSIFGPLRDFVNRSTSARLVSLIDVVTRDLSTRPSRPVGLLATEGTVRAGTVEGALAAVGCPVLVPDGLSQKRVDRAIGHIKAGNPALAFAAREELLAVSRRLARRGAAVLLLGCTEIPLVITEPAIDGAGILDPVRELARALIAEARSTRFGSKRNKESDRDGPRRAPSVRPTAQKAA